jgi:hypothetical protein
LLLLALEIVAKMGGERGDEVKARAENRRTCEGDVELRESMNFGIGISGVL